MPSTLASFTSEKLVELYQKDPDLKEKAFEILCERYDRIVLKKISKELRLKANLSLSYEEIKEQARDLKQDFLFEKFANVIEKYDPKKGNIDNWIKKMCAKLCQKRLTKTV